MTKDPLPTLPPPRTNRSGHLGAPGLKDVIRQAEYVSADGVTAEIRGDWGVGGGVGGCAFGGVGGRCWGVERGSVKVIQTL